MALVPGVYVTIEDRSYIESQPALGRTGLICIMGDRGPHNQVTQLTSNSELFAYYGKPEIERTGQAHYIASNFLNFSNRLYVIRPVLLDSPNPAHNCAFSNAIIRYTPPNGSEEILQGKFVFTNKADALTKFGDEFISQYVFTNYIGYSSADIGSTIANDEDGLSYALEIETKGEIESTGTSEQDRIYWLKLKAKYTGQSTVDEDNANELLVSYSGTDPLVFINYSANPYTTFASRAVEYFDGPILNSVGKFTFKNGSNIVVADNEASFDSVRQEEWIYPVSSDVSKVLQVSSKFIDPVSGEFQLFLNDLYTGTTSTAAENVFTYDAFKVHSYEFIKSDIEFDESSSTNLFYFYGQGVGTYYNTIFIQAVRNTQLEKMYTDEDGEPLYKYAFMDITIRGENPDGTSTVLEGPWSCSLVNKVGNQVVRDLNTGRELYIVKTINERSKYIKCKEGFNSSVLEGLGAEKDKLRLNVMALFSVSFVDRTSTRGQEGFYLENGSNGIQYDQWNRLNIYHPEIKQLIRNAYNTNLKSVDGSIELLLHTVYPWYILDYVMAGGYDLDIQSAARSMVDSRQDCLLLADTGQYSRNSQEDIDIRKTSQMWNTWNAAIYTQYREITDPFSGKPLTISPVYHAIERHLFVDNNYFMSEPVAGIEKGAIQERVKLAYKPSLRDMEDMIDYELNPVITEPDGTYIITQFTSYKRLSVMKRIHAVKIVQHLRKRIPSLLKTILQRRATPYWISVAQSIINTFMDQFTNSNSPKYSFTSYDAKVIFDEERSEMYISLTVRPIRAIEAIHVNIIVV